MDVRREGAAQARRRRVILWSCSTGAALVLAGFGVSRLEPGVPSAPRASLWVGEVDRGQMVRKVRGVGTLVPEQTLHISASTKGTVERIVERPGAQVTPQTILIVLANPELEQSTEDARLELRAREAEQWSLEIQSESDLLDNQAQAARLASERKQAELQATADEDLGKEGLVPEIVQRLSRLRADELANRSEIEQQRVASARRVADSRLDAQSARLEQQRALYKLRLQQVGDLQVVSDIPGVLQEVLVEVGQSVTPGQPLAVVASLERLRAELRIPETQAKDLAGGQKVSIDTRNGLVTGKVARVDPGVRDGAVLVDVSLPLDLPQGALPDLSVEGSIEIERLADVLYVGMPAYGRPNAKTTVFRLGQDGTDAWRVPVELGRASVGVVEIVSGLVAGDRVVLSDTSEYEDYDRIRIE